MKPLFAGMERWVSSARIRLSMEWEELAGTERKGGAGGGGGEIWQERKQENSKSCNKKGFGRKNVLELQHHSIYFWLIWYTQ